MTLEDALRPPPEGIERRPANFAARLLMGGPVTLVTSAFRGEQNVMPLAWHAPLSSDPPLIGISIERSRHSVDMIQHSEEFALNFPARPLIHHVQYLGALTGAEVDKFEATQLATFPAARLTAPLIEGCAAWIECEVQQVVPIGDHVLFVGLPVAVQVDPEAFDERWSVGPEPSRPLHYIGGNRYAVLQRTLEARVPGRGEAPERFLAERIEEELELTREAQERREELLTELREEIEAGNIVDLSQFDLDAFIAQALPDLGTSERPGLPGPSESDRSER
ncbi:MAG: flavin reductase family protein [Dehalococcoidia bacterium]